MILNDNKGIPLPSLVIKDIPTISYREQFVFMPGQYEQLSHHKRFNGGDWMLTFTIKATNTGDGISAATLKHWFRTWIMYKVIEVSEGSETWEGVIWEMEIIVNGVKKRRSVETCSNAVKVIYLPVDETVWLETAWYLSDASILKYLRRERLVYLDEGDTTHAEELAQTELALHVEPTLELLGVDAGEEDQLKITVVGDWFTLNNRYTDATLIGEDTIGNLVIDAMTDVDYVQVGMITANPIVIEREMMEPVRVGDYLLRLAAIGGEVNGVRQPWHVYCKNGRLHYGPVGTDPTLEWHGNEYGFRLVSGQDAHWGLEPGIVRDYTEDAGPVAPESYLQDYRDLLIEEVKMSQGQPRPRIGTEGFGEELMKANLEDFEGWTTDYDFDRLHTPVGETPPPHPDPKKHGGRYPIEDIHV